MTKLSVALIGVFVMLFSAGCSDDEKPSNQLKVDGRTIKFHHGYMISAPDTDEEFGNVSVHFVVLVSEGLDYDVVEDSFIGEGDGVIFMVASQASTLVKGTYRLRDLPNYGDLVDFQAGVGVVNNEDPQIIYSGLYGDLEVKSVKNDTYTFEFDFDQVEKIVGDNSVTIEGDMDGYFRVELEIIEGSILSRKSKGFNFALFK